MDNIKKEKTMEKKLELLKIKKKKADEKKLTSERSLKIKKEKVDKIKSNETKKNCQKLQAHRKTVEYGDIIMCKLLFKSL